MPRRLRQVSGKQPGNSRKTHHVLVHDAQAKVKKTVDNRGNWCKLRTKEVFMMSTAATQQIVNDRRKAVLTDLRDQANMADLSDDPAFQRLLNACQGLFEMSDDELAEIFMVSRPTINRWSNGKNLPHRRVRKAVFNWISNTALKRVRMIEKYELANRREAEKFNVVGA